MKIAVDLDGTLAYFDEWKGPTFIGDPIPSMIRLVKALLQDGHEVSIFTARITAGTPYDNTGAYEAVRRWVIQHIGQELEVTNVKKDFDVFFDDRAVRVDRNQGLELKPNTSSIKPYIINTAFALAGFLLALLLKAC